MKPRFRGFCEKDTSKSTIIINEKQIKGWWAEGNLYVDIDGKMSEISMGLETYRRTYPVIPETVGQFTGFLDKKENFIYEQDRVKFLGKIWEVCFDYGAFGIRSKEPINWEYIKEQVSPDIVPQFCEMEDFISFQEIIMNFDCGCSVEDMEVIGTIWDGEQNERRID